MTRTKPPEELSVEPTCGRFGSELGHSGRVVLVLPPYEHPSPRIGRP
ncbi:hypothetical protein [Leptospira sp. severe_002]|nr:hypothetical protein [Leptospira sp. severe_002]